VETHELAAHQPAEDGLGVGGGVDRSQQEVTPTADTGVG
jgi:hypothetical protein